MRPTLFLLGIWHGLFCIAGVLWSLCWIVEFVRGSVYATGGFGKDVAIVLGLCLTSLVGLPLVAQGTKGFRLGGLLVFLPFAFALISWAFPRDSGLVANRADFSAWAGFFSILLLPGGILGLYGLLGKPD